MGLNGAGKNSPHFCKKALSKYVVFVNRVNIKKKNSLKLAQSKTIYYLCKCKQTTTRTAADGINNGKKGYEEDNEITNEGNTDNIQ